MAQLELKTKPQLAKDAHTLASGSEMVRYRSTTYIPAHYETGITEYPPPPEERIWLPMSREDMRKQAAERFSTLFVSDGELSSFDFMVAQNAEQVTDVVDTLLVRTPDGLMQLNHRGKLKEPSGDFVPNALRPMLNPDDEEKARVLQVFAEWLDSEDEAHALLHHLATALAPGFSAIKYVLLLGEGRNGKGTLLKMLMGLFGRENMSQVTRQHMAEQNPVVTELNGKLLNVIFDGQSDYLKDSGTEKTLVAGEPAPIRRLYDSTPTIVQTNALFIEALNNEPKSKDKSPALQKRLVRFQFPNVYATNYKFEQTMLGEKSLGAFLALLIDHYVVQDKVALALAPTQKAIELQLEHMYVNSVALQFLKHIAETDAMGVDAILGEPQAKLVAEFQSWRIKEGDLGTWAEPDVVAQFIPLVNTERRSVRMHSTVRKVRVVTSLKLEATQFLETLEGDEDDGDDEALVAV